MKCQMLGFHGRFYFCRCMVSQVNCFHFLLFFLQTEFPDSFRTLLSLDGNLDAIPFYMYGDVKIICKMEPV